MSGNSPNAAILATARARWLETYRALDASLPHYSTTSADISHVRELIDAEVAGVHILLSALYERRNDTTLPSLLPPEILAHIFSFLLEQDSPFPFYYRTRQSINWVSVSHVCRRWRKICLDQPSLWAQLDTGENFPWDMFLERAKKAPLIISGPLDLLRDGTTRLQSILDHRHHIRELQLYDVPSPHLVKIVNGFNGVYTQLRVLLLSRPSHEMTSSPTLPTEFLSDLAPNVQELSLYGVPFPWGQGSPTITKFVYLYDHKVSTHTHVFGDVVHTLQRMPSLKMLKFVDIFPPAAASPLTDSDIICLPLLEALCLSAENDQPWTLWSRLRIPSTSSINVDGKHGGELDSLIVSTLQAHLRTAPVIHYDSLDTSVDAINTSMLRFALSRSTSEGLGHSPNDSPAPSITLRIRSPQASLENTARQLMALTALEDIRELTWSGAACRDREMQMFLQAVRSVRSVTTLHVGRCYGAGHVLAALIPSASVTANRPQTENIEQTLEKTTLIFPALRHLACDNVNFFEIVVLPTGSRVFAGAALEQALENRSTLGLPLQSLELDKCDVLWEWVDMWKPFVEYITWDGGEGRLPELEESDEDDEDVQEEEEED